MVCFMYKELSGSTRKSLSRGEGELQVQVTVLPSHLRKLISNASTNTHPVRGIWLGETGTGFSVGGPSQTGTLVVALETRKHTGFSRSNLKNTHSARVMEKPTCPPAPHSRVLQPGPAAPAQERGQERGTHGNPGGSFGATEPSGESQFLAMFTSE